MSGSATAASDWRAARRVLQLAPPVFPDIVRLMSRLVKSSPITELYFPQLKDAETVLKTGLYRPEWSANGQKRISVRDSVRLALISGSATKPHLARNCHVLSPELPGRIRE